MSTIPASLTVGTPVLYKYSKYSTREGTVVELNEAAGRVRVHFPAHNVRTWIQAKRLTVASK